MASAARSLSCSTGREPSLQGLGQGRYLSRSPRPFGLPALRRNARLAAPRASDLKDHGPSGEEWRPPSDWDKAWKAYKKVSSTSPPSALGKAGSSMTGSMPSPPTSSSSSSSTRGPRFQSPLRHMEQYVSRSPNHSNYPLSEEPDPLRRTERQTLGAWTDQRFHFAGAGVIAAMFVYMVLIVGPPA